MKLLRYLGQYHVQLLAVALFFGSRLNKRRAILRFHLKGKLQIEAVFWTKILLATISTTLIYDVAYRSGIPTGETAWDKVILLLPILITGLAFWLCYECELLNAFTYTVMACVAQNLVFNVHGVARVMLKLQLDSLASVVIVLVAMIIVSVPVYLIFSRRLKEWMYYPVNRSHSVFITFSILVYTIFLNLRMSDESILYSVYSTYIVGDLFCLLLLFNLFYESGLKQKYRIMEQLLYAEQRMQKMNRENTELINRKCHDLKQQINALRSMGKSAEMDAYLREIEQATEFYESNIRTGNKMLDLLLMEKLLYCKQHRIKLSCIVEGEKLAFIDSMDLYSLFGNALDNAIESVVQETDVEKRTISFKVASQGKILSIHFENYIGHELEFADDLPLTTKSDKEYHGFGMMSIRYIVEKYGGTMQISATDNLFQLNILMLIPTKES